MEDSELRATVGVLELQGDFAEHTAMLQECGVTTRGVRLPADLDGIDGLVIPGGESTTMGKLLVELNFMEPLQAKLSSGLPIFGTCAGCIMLSKEIQGYPDQPRIGAIDMTVDRNTYGTQVDSFETTVKASGNAHDDIFKGEPLRAVLIRAPGIVQTGPNVKILAQLGDRPIIVQQGNALATTFHPELTKDTRIHRLFLHMVRAHTLADRTAALKINQ